MLRANGEIKFTLEGRNYAGGRHLRPVFRFGEGLLFSGTIKSDSTEYLYNNVYTVDIEFFTVNDEAYAALIPVLADGLCLTIREGSRVIGIASLSNFEYDGAIVNSNSHFLVSYES